MRGSPHRRLRGFVQRGQTERSGLRFCPGRTRWKRGRSPPSTWPRGQPERGLWPPNCKKWLPLPGPRGLWNWSELRLARGLLTRDPGAALVWSLMTDTGWQALTGPTQDHPLPGPQLPTRLAVPRAAGRGTMWCEHQGAGSARAQGQGLRHSGVTLTGTRARGQMRSRSGACCRPTWSERRTAEGKGDDSNSSPRPPTPPPQAGPVLGSDDS